MKIKYCNICGAFCSYHQSLQHKTSCKMFGDEEWYNLIQNIETLENYIQGLEKSLQTVNQNLEEMKILLDKKDEEIIKYCILCGAFSKNDEFNHNEGCEWDGEDEHYYVYCSLDEFKNKVNELFEKSQLANKTLAEIEKGNKIEGEKE